MAILDITMVIGAIVALGIENGLEKIKREELVLQTLSKVGLKPGSPPDDFDGIYTYTLIEYGINMPKSILDFFRNEYIKEAFHKSFTERNFVLLEDEANNFIEWNKLGAEYKQKDIDIRGEFNKFKDIFYNLVEKSRKPTQVVTDQKIDDLFDQVHSVAVSFQSIKNAFDKREKEVISPSAFLLMRLKESNGFINNIPPLPDYYVARNEYIYRLENLLGLEKNKQETSSRIVAVNGFAGVGKSILVKALASRKEIVDFYTNGIFWANLGPDVIDGKDTESILSEWLIANGLNPDGYPDHSKKALAIKAFTSEGKYLFILDDVWNLSSTNFLISLCGRYSQVIITTRNKELISRLGIIKTCEVGQLESNEARELIENRLQKPLQDKVWQEKVKPLLDRIEWNALGTSLTAAQLLLGDKDGAELLSDFDDLRSKLPIDFDDPSSPDESVNLSIDLSVRLLDEKSRERFAWLGVMAKGEYFSLEDIAMLWSILIFPDYPEEVTDHEGNLKRQDFVLV